MLGPLGLILYGGGKPFHPLDLGPAVYDLWDAAAAGTITSVGAAVSEWRSVKGARPASQAIGASRPLYAAAGLNGGPTLVYDGADDFLRFENSDFLPLGAAPVEIWWLGTQEALAADTSVRVAACYGGPGSAFYRAARRTVGNGQNYAAALVGNGAVGVAGQPVAEFFGPCVVRTVITPTETITYLNGVASAPAAVVPGTTNQRVTLGAANNSTAANFHLGKKSLVSFTAGLNANQAAQMLAYYKARGGIA